MRFPLRFSAFQVFPAADWVQDKTAIAFYRFIFCTQSLCRFILTGYWVHDKTVALITVLLCYCSQTLNRECYSIAPSIDPLYLPLTDGSRNEWLV